MTTHQSLSTPRPRRVSSLLSVEQYDVRLDLAASDETFGSVTTIRFSSRGGPTFVDLKPARVHEIRLNGRARPGPAGCRLPLDTEPGTNEVVDATMVPQRRRGAAHRSVDPADGRHYVYGMSSWTPRPASSRASTSRT